MENPPQEIEEEPPERRTEGVTEEVTGRTTVTVASQAGGFNSFAIRLGAGKKMVTSVFVA